MSIRVGVSFDPAEDAITKAIAMAIPGTPQDCNQCVFEILGSLCKHDLMQRS